MMLKTVRTVCGIVTIFASLIPSAFANDSVHISLGGGGCPSHPCFTLSAAIENSAQIFTSNTKVTFPNGTFTIAVGKSILIQDVNNLTFTGGYLNPKYPAETEHPQYTVFKCNKSFGIIFLNVTNIILHGFQFYHCGDSLSPNVLEAINFVTSTDHITDYFVYLNPVLTFIHTLFLEIINIVVSNSTGGPGIFGINTLGFSSIKNSSCLYNRPNTIFLFLQTVLSVRKYNFLDINNSEFSSGTPEFMVQGYAAGLSIAIQQRNYYVRVSLNELTLQDNQGWLYGNLLLTFWSCSCMCGDIQANRLNVSGGKGSGISFNAEGVVRGYTECNCGFLDSHVLQLNNVSVYSHDNEDSILLRNACLRTPSAIVEITNISAHNINMGQAIRAWHMPLVVLEGVNITNVRGRSGISAIESTVIFGGVTYISTMDASDQSAVAAWRSNLTFCGRAIFIKNKGYSAGAIYAHNSSVTFSGKLKFVENQGYNGGGLALHGGSILILKDNTEAVFVRNHAIHRGGGLYVNNPATQYHVETHIGFEIPDCFFMEDNTDHTVRSANISFLNNSAISAGSDIYGGSVDICKELLIKYKMVYGIDYFKTAFHVHENASDASQVTSDPYRVCICDSGTPNCTVFQHNTTAFPGQMFYIDAVAIGQMYGTVPSTVRSELLFDYTNSALESLEYTQRVGRECTNLRYTIFSNNNYETLTLKPVEMPNVLHKNEHRFDMMVDVINRGWRELLSDLVINVTLLPCPLGFLFQNHSCNNCNPTLIQHNISCDISTQTIERNSPLWVTAIALNTTHHGVIVHEHCPFDYCKPKTVQLNLQHPDKQCAFHRSAILCGKCQHSFSHTLGSSNCKQCSNTWILLLIPFALAGVALAAFLMLLNLTVSVGSINGLVFYANVVRANQAVFFPHDARNVFYNWFIAWINLDLGMETCFFKGLDAYVKTWLQFVFPAYIWIIVILIIVSSHYTTKAARLFGRNAVQVLATLFLLSYAKLLQATITILSSTTLEYPDGSVRRIWLYDGNVDYLKGKHIPLFMAALLVLLVLSLPYTALLLFIQCLQLKSNYRVLFWIGKFKPLFDAYTGPYKDKHRYWTGLLLLVRAALFMIFSVNVFGDPAINILAITLTVFCLFAFLVLFAEGKIYKAWYCNALECAFLFNLGFLCSGTLFCRLTDGNQAALTDTSVSFTFAIFSVVVVLHATSRLRQYGIAKVLATKLASQWRTIYQRKKKANTPQGGPNETQAAAAISHRTPVTFIDLREPLLEYHN